MTLAMQLAKYGEYHRDHRNVMTHMAGIPMIVLSVTTLLARPVFTVPLLGIDLTPAMIVAAMAAFWYVQLDIKLGLMMTALLAALVALGGLIAQLSTAAWLGGGIGLFVLGWIFQLVGHKFEGRKPAFIDDLRGLLVGPLFVLVEVLFALGLMRDLRDEMERSA